MRRMLCRSLFSLAVLLGLVGAVGGLDLATAKDCGDGIAPCACGDRVTTSTALDSSDPVLTTACPCNGVVVASGVTLSVGGTIRSLGAGFCSDPNVPFPVGVLIEDGATDVGITGGRTIGFEIGVFGPALSSSRVAGMQVLNAVSFGIAVDLNRGSEGNTIENNVVRNAGFVGIVVSGNRNRVCQNRVESSGEGIFEEGTENTICLNVVSRSQTQGITSVGDNGTVSRNRIQYGGGVAVFGSGNLFTGNTALEDVADGFIVVPPATHNVFRRNAASYNARFGIADFSTGNVYEDNRCTGNAAGPSFPARLCP